MYFPGFEYHFTFVSTECPYLGRTYPYILGNANRIIKNKLFTENLFGSIATLDKFDCVHHLANLIFNIQFQHTRNSSEIYILSIFRICFFYQFSF